jgi:RimK family alpha-L-glutamate ligase
MAGPSVAVLSYPSVQPGNMASLRRACEAAGVPLAEVLPHELWLRLGEETTVWVDDRRFEGDVVLHRTVFPYRAFVLPLLDALASSGHLVLNEPQAAATSRNKLRTALALRRRGLPTVPTDVLAGPPPPGWQPRPAWQPRGHSSGGPPPQPVVVTKPALGTQGRDVVRLRASEVAAHVRAYDQDAGPTIVQPFVDGDYDLRSFVVDSACIAVGARHHAAGEWRCNVALGGTVTAVQDPVLRARAADLAVAAVDALGLDYAAVDLLHDASADALYVSEVDAWGGFVGLEEALGVDVAGRIVHLAIERWSAAR